MMNLNDIQPIVMVYHRKLATVSLQFKRYLYAQINWQVRLVGIKGARGVGKTTLILQHIKECFDHIDTAFYVSLDNLWFKTHDLMDLVEYLYTHQTTHIFLDEVHKYPDWSLTIKNIYDNYPNLNIVYTGSSMLEIDNSQVDLSRRQTLYSLKGMSFREYLEYENIMDVAPFQLTDILTNHINLSMNIVDKTKILYHFDKYLKYGYYPYYREAVSDYALRLNEVVNLIIESDLPAVEEVSFHTIQKTKKLLMIMAQSVPFTPNISQLCAQLNTTRDLCLKLLHALEQAGLLILLHQQIKNYKQLSKPNKIFLNNTNLMYALSGNVSEGSLRETFFANQVGAFHSITMPSQGDFLIDETYLFEVGGHGKTFSQIADIPNSFLAVDNMEIGSGCKIPLWLFGMMY